MESKNRLENKGRRKRLVLEEEPQVEEKGASMYLVPLVTSLDS